MTRSTVFVTAAAVFNLRTVAPPEFADTRQANAGVVANLWRRLAVAWLGGMASPALLDEPAPACAPLVTVAAPVETEMGQGAGEAAQHSRGAGDQTTTDDGL
jgi:hypothetical protein